MSNLGIQTLGVLLPLNTKPPLIQLFRVVSCWKEHPGIPFLILGLCWGSTKKESGGIWVREVSNSGILLLARRKNFLTQEIHQIRLRNAVWKWGAGHVDLNISSWVRIIRPGCPPLSKTRGHWGLWGKILELYAEGIVLNLFWIKKNPDWFPAFALSSIYSRTVWVSCSGQVEY